MGGTWGRARCGGFHDGPPRSRLALGLVLGAALLTGCGAGGPAGSADTGRPQARSTASAGDTECRAGPTGPTTYAYAERPATDPDLTSLDVYLPAGCGPAPVVVWVHGGGWSVGDKAAGLVERKAQWAASVGAALVSVNYRLTTGSSGVRWPDHGEDVATAVAWVQQRGPDLGLRPTGMTLLGHSAGAHLVAILGTDPSLLAAAGANPRDVACVAALDFSFDLVDGPSEDLVAEAFGTDPEVLAAASPSVQVQRNGAPSARFLVATRGDAGRVADARDFVDLINDDGGSAELVDLTGYSHSQVSSQLGAPGEDRVTPPVSEFVRSCTAGQ